MKGRERVRRNRGNAREMALHSDPTAGGGGGAKRPRSDAQGAAEASPISALPDELRQRVLTLLPLKDAIRTGALARGWRGLWRTRWAHRSAVEVHLSSRDAPERELDALEKEPRPRLRLHRFSLTVDTCKFTSSHLRRFLSYAAECRTEDLSVEMWTASKLKFHLPRSSPLLARLSLRRIGVAGMYYRGAQPLRALEVVALHSVSITQAAVKKMLALCPGLRTLDLRACDAVQLLLLRQIRGLAAETEEHHHRGVRRDGPSVPGERAEPPLLPLQRQLPRRALLPSARRRACRPLHLL